MRGIQHRREGYNTGEKDTTQERGVKHRRNRYNIEERDITQKRRI